MKFKITSKELGIQDCDFVATGDTAGDVVEQVVNHLRDEHDIDMPDAEVILQGEVVENPLSESDPAVELVVERLTSALNIVTPQETEKEQPHIPRVSTAI